jgi:NAD(P)-dependent dehydrogenase (short-subunit alcohol dehydrogenase family)
VLIDVRSAGRGANTSRFNRWYSQTRLHLVEMVSGHRGTQHTSAGYRRRFEWFLDYELDTIRAREPSHNKGAGGPRSHAPRDKLMNPSDRSASLRLENQVAVVSGGARGIGAGIVRRFVEEGARVVFSDLLDEKGKVLEEELGENVAFQRADASSPSDTEALMKFAVERFGKLDCVVNNAGAGGEGGPIAGTSIEGFDRSIALLLRGPFLGIKYAVSHMESGTIINIASVAAVGGGYGPHAYTAAKFGVVGLTKSVALELAERGIRVNAICPGGTATFIWAPLFPELTADLVEQIPDLVKTWVGEVNPLGRAGLPADIANAALWLASSESSWVTGQALVVDGGLTVGRPWSQGIHRIDQLKEQVRSVLNKRTVTS